MMRLSAVLLLLVAGLIGPAAAQGASTGFPLNKAFKVISISGFDVQKAGITLTVAPDAQASRLVGSGSAGCNQWSATIVLRDDQIDITNIATTRKMCPKPRMTSEEAFLTTLRSAQRWRVNEKDRLIIEGEAARLLLTSAAAGKPAEKKPSKK